MKSFFEKLTGNVDIDDEDVFFDDHENEEKRESRHLEIKGDSKRKNAIENEGDWIDEEVEEGELTIDMYQNPDEIIIKTMVAGVKPEDLDISISRDMVTIKGQREESHIVDDEDYFSRELYWGSFSRTITLPTEINIEEAKAEEKQGLLTLVLPKTDKGRQTKLKVKSS